MRLIDADAIMPKMQKEFDMQDTYLPIHFQQLIVDEIPTIKAEPTVLCHECKHYKKHYTFGREIGYCERGCKYDPRMSIYMPEDGFCSFGERKET